jgi:anti-sigma B factor antagonist
MGSRPTRCAPDLTTRSQRTGAQTTVHVTGEIDLHTASALETALERARLDVLAPFGHPDLLVDLREVSFLGAAGLRVLAVVHLRCVADGTSMRVLGSQRAVLRPMELTGLQQLVAG